MSHNRNVQTVEVVKRDGDTITTDQGWSWMLRAELRDHVRVGTIARIETIQFSRMVGWFDVATDRWLWRWSDQDIDADDQRFRDDMDRRHAEQLAANRDDWTRREQALPAWLKARLDTFHARGGNTFELEGWGYELTVAEVAALWDAAVDRGHQLPSGPFDTTVQDPPEVLEYAEKHGTSGNQHDMAVALARSHRDGNSVAGTVSALSPITGDAFYEGEARP